MIRGYIDPNFPNPRGPGDASIVIYGYTPSLTLGILGAALFAGLLTLHFLQVFRHRFWSFSILLVACIMEIIGYVFRILSSRVDPYRIAFFVGQYFCITCAPVFVSAGIYIYLTEFMLWAMRSGFPSEAITRLKLTPSRLLWMFVSIDVVCTLLQITGASLIGNRTSKQQDPTEVNRILIAGLVVQAAAFLLFMSIMTLVIAACSRCARENYELAAKWKKMRLACGGILSAGVLVLLRTIFRLAESAEGVFGYLSSHEAFFGALEFAPIVLALILLSIWHPGRIFRDMGNSTDKNGFV